MLSPNSPHRRHNFKRIDAEKRRVRLNVPIDFNRVPANAQAKTCQSRPTAVETYPAGTQFLNCLLLHEVEGAGTANNAEAFVAGACTLGFFELRLDVVAIIRALRGEDSGAIFP